METLWLKPQNMHLGTFVFAQIVEFIPRFEFDKCVKRYNGFVGKVFFGDKQEDCLFIVGINYRLCRNFA